MQTKQSNAFSDLRAKVFAANHTAAVPKVGAFYDGKSPALAASAGESEHAAPVLTIQLTRRHATHSTAFSKRDSR